MEESVNSMYIYEELHSVNVTNITYLNVTNVTTDISISTKKPVLYDPPTYIVALLYLLYGAICLIALVGNVVVLWLVLGSKKMRTVTNMFISNLAFADVIMAVFIIPFHFQAALFQRWDLPHFLCPVCPFVQILSVTLSGFTLSVIAIHRYRGIMSPLKTPISKKNAGWTLLLMWIICIIVALPTAFDYIIVNYDRVDYCNNIGLPATFRVFYNQFVVIVQYFLPLLTITVAYIRMGLSLWTSETPGNEERSRDLILFNTKLKVTRMLVLVVILFGVFWFPLQTYNFLLTLYPSINDFPYINMIWFSIHWLAMSNSCCNPFVYGIYNENFREEFRNRMTGSSLRSLERQVNIQLVGGGRLPCN